MAPWVDLRKQKCSIYLIPFDIPKEHEFLGKIKSLGLDFTIFYSEIIRYINESEQIILPVLIFLDTFYHIRKCFSLQVLNMLLNIYFKVF